MELTITRLFDAPPALVFQAFVEPRRLLQWMGPHARPVVESDTDPRPGGKWRARLAGPGDLRQHGVYREVVPGKRLVYTFAWEDDGEVGPETLITVTFADQDGRTLMTFHQAPFATVSALEGHRAGWGETFDRLVAHLARQSP